MKKRKQNANRYRKTISAKKLEAVRNRQRAVARRFLFNKVIQAIKGEREYQDKKWPGHQHTLAEWFLIIQTTLTKAEVAWFHGHGDEKQALHELRQVAAVAVAAMEQCGVLEREPLMPPYVPRNMRDKDEPYFRGPEAKKKRRVIDGRTPYYLPPASHRETDVREERMMDRDASRIRKAVGEAVGARGKKKPWKRNYSKALAAVTKKAERKVTSVCYACGGTNGRHAYRCEFKGTGKLLRGKKNIAKRGKARR